MAENLMPEILNRRGFSIGEKNDLLFEEVSLQEIADRYGTPCYIYSENIIRQQCRDYSASFTNSKIDYKIIYAGKAFLVKALCKILAQEGLGIDASSGGEIHTALSAGFPAEDIYFHGNNKSKDELIYAVENNTGTIMVDNLFELALLDKIASDFNKKVNIMIRFIPGVDTHTHEKIRTGQVDSKFGIPIAKLDDVFPEILQKKNLNYTGIHCHIGSQLLETQFHLQAIIEMGHAIQRIKDKFGIETRNLNIGGGLGVKYTGDDKPVAVKDFVDIIINKFKETCQELKIPVPRIIIEPGRSIVAEAGITLYQVGAIKKIDGLKKYLLVDGGMADNPRPSLYDAKYEAVIVNKFNQKPAEDVTIAGKYCESGDILIKNIKLPEADHGDLIVFFSTGAYHHAMASNYNGIPRPAVVLVNKGKDDLMVKRETYDDLNHNHVLPAWLKN
ncbi:MAG: diaminopimelate decarboxylase [Atribacterota bacterium]|nr:diaminopimelate decarboxylase [Atribacterota bacterium]